jgi:hypothetical protein
MGMTKQVSGVNFTAAGELAGPAFLVGLTE